VTGAHDRTVKVWDMTTGNTLKTVFCFSSTNDVTLSESYSAIISAHLDGKLFVCFLFFLMNKSGALRLWDLRSGEATQENKEAHTKQITRYLKMCWFLCL
jgi:autophagy-related protein 16